MLRVTSHRRSHEPAILVAIEARKRRRCIRCRAHRLQQPRILMNGQRLTAILINQLDHITTDLSQPRGRDMRRAMHQNLALEVAQKLGQRHRAVPIFVRSGSQAMKQIDSAL